MLVQICCSVDSHYFLMRLKELYPTQKLVGYFYNPNIHPYAEYKLRFEDVKRSCKKLDVELIDGEYEVGLWFDDTKGLENEPEKGQRCLVCFENRLRASAKKCVELGLKKITTTLLMSPKKSMEQLNRAGERIASEFGLEFVSHDFRKQNGTQLQFKVAKDEGLYHQNYCGCMYALKKQREIANVPEVELYSHISKQVQFGSIEERLEFFRVHVAKKSHRFLNYRLLRAFVKCDGEVVASYVLSYSKTNKKENRGEFIGRENGVAYFSKEPMIAISLEFFNLTTCRAYTSIKELLKNPLSLEEEQKFRAKITHSFFDLTPIFIFESIPQNRCEIYLDAICFEDVRQL